VLCGKGSGLVTTFSAVLVARERQAPKSTIQRNIGVGELDAGRGEGQREESTVQRNSGVIDLTIKLKFDQFAPSRVQLP
jgi:hypothetical protein